MANSQLTDIGLQKFNTADPLNPVKITHIAVGDGNGSTPTVDPSRTSLVNEVYRGTASLPMVVSTDPKILRWELEIPATEGGFTVREACLIDEDGDMLSFALTDPILKPDPATSIGNIYIVELNHTLINEDDDLVIDFNAGRGVPAQNVEMDQGGSLQDFADSFALKVFQSPTDGLTEIYTRTLLGGEVYEVRKVSDDSLATIYTDKEGLNPIVQNGTSNVSGSDGGVTFYIADGDYYVEVDSVKSNFSTVISAEKVITNKGETAENEIRKLLKTQSQPSIIDKIISAATPSMSYARADSGTLYVGSVFGGNPYSAPPLVGYVTAIEWKFLRNDDGLYLIRGGFSGDAVINQEYQGNVVLDGAFTLSYPNPYATTVGDTVTGVFQGGREFHFEAFKDNRGGLWRISIDGRVFIVSTYSDASGRTSELICDGLNESKSYDYTLEYLGDDPDNPPVGGVSRGWVFYDPANDDVKPVFTYAFTGLSNTKELSAEGSVNDFALSVRQAGSATPSQWVPQHGSVDNVSVNVALKIFIDGKLLLDASGGSADIGDLAITEIESMSIQTRFTAQNPDEGVPLWTHYLVESFSEGVMTITNRLEFLTDTRVLGYLALIGVNAEFLSRISYASGDEFQVSTDSADNFDYNSTSGVLYAGAFDSGRGIYHGIGCDVDVYSSCSVGKIYEPENTNLQTFRADNVTKTYWRAAYDTTVPQGSIMKSTVKMAMVNGVRFPNADIKSI